MSSLYIDYFSHVCLTKRVKQTYNGASNGTKLLLLQILESNYYGIKDIFLILPKGYKAGDSIEKNIIEAKFIQKIYVNDLRDVNYSTDAILLIPLVCGREMIMAEKIRKRFPNLKIYGRIHDKNHNFPFDFYDRYYFLGWKRTGLYSVIDFWGKKVLFSLKYSSWIKNFDKIFTVSNYSLQKLSHKNVSFINYYYQGILDYYTNTDCEKNLFNDEFILFVNGGRPVKNCLRAIEAFSKYKYNFRNDKIKLYITSINPKTQTALLKKLKNIPYFNLHDIVFFDYVDYDTLRCLYSNSKFLLFLSKGEGFGLPVLESLFCGRPILASWSSSIPEVAGASVRYVNPFDVNSIMKGIEYYRDNDHLNFYIEAIKRRKLIIEELIKEDSKMLIRELFEE